MKPDTSPHNLGAEITQRRIWGTPSKNATVSKILSLLGAQNPLRYIKSAFWLTTAKAISMLVSLVATFYVARVLGPQNFGELSYAQSIIGILAVLGSLTGVLYRDIIAKKEEEGTLLGTAWVVSLGNSVITTILAAIYIFIFPHSPLTILVISIILLSQFFNPFYVISNIFYAKTETKWLALLQLGIHILISGSKVIAMIFGHGILVLACIFVLEHIITALMLSILYIYLHKGSFFTWRFSLPYSKKMMLDSLPIVVISTSGLVSGRIDQVLLNHFIDTATVGLYSVAVQLSEIWQFIPGIVLTALFPIIVNTKHNPLIYRRRLASLAGIIIVFGLCVSLITTLLAPYIIPLIYGAAFSNSIPILQIYIWSLTGITLGFLVSNFLITENLRTIQIITGVVPMVLNVILNIILIPIYGALGAAVATVFSYSLFPLIPFLFKTTRTRLTL